MADIEKLVGKVSAELYERKEIPSYDKLLEMTRLQARILEIAHDGASFTEDDSLLAAANIQTRHDTTMGLGVLFAAETYTPWLADKLGEINFYYWNRYKQLLQEKMSGDVVLKIDNVTDRILDHLENPLKDGTWERRG